MFTLNESFNLIIQLHRLSVSMQILNKKCCFTIKTDLYISFSLLSLSRVLHPEGLGLLFPLIWNQRPQNGRWMQAWKKVIESGITAHGKYVGPLFPPQWNPKIFASVFFLLRGSRSWCERKQFHQNKNSEWELSVNYHWFSMHEHWERNSSKLFNQLQLHFLN